MIPVRVRSFLGDMFFCLRLFIRDTTALPMHHYLVAETFFENQLAGVWLLLVDDIFKVSYFIVPGSAARNSNIFFFSEDHMYNLNS